MNQLAGIHHVTAIAGDAQSNIDFYTGFLGLRLVKVTVNFDAPETYHFYYGDGLGRPGTLLTFFAQPDARQSRKGPGQASIVAFAIPPAAIRYWMDRLAGQGILYEGPIHRGEHTLLTFFDADDLQIELVACPEADGREPWAGGPVPEAYALRGLYGVTLVEENLEQSADLLTPTLGFQYLGEMPNNRYRFRMGQGSNRAYVDLLVLPRMAAGRMGIGAIHHVAWRTPDPAGQLRCRETLTGLGYRVTPVLDRQYFRSIYFQEPGGVRFEIATDGPGFTIDEDPASLGTALQLPPHLAPQRAAIANRLPALRLPETYSGDSMPRLLAPLFQRAKASQETASEI
jgi:glyoxalase family protein